MGHPYLETLKLFFLKSLIKVLCAGLVIGFEKQTSRVTYTTGPTVSEFW
jgi:hypothetical protein